MTTSEFSYEFDVLYNNVTSNQAPGLNGYEKSVFLTKAEKQLVQEYFNQRTDVQGGGFDGSPKRQIDFSNLIRTEELTDIGSPLKYVRIDPRSYIFTTQAEIISILNEFLDVTPQGLGVTPSTLTVKPLSYDEYTRLMMKPYKYPPKGIAWRLINGDDAEAVRSFELIAKILPGNTAKYRIRYIRKPAPIILENLNGLGVTIDGGTSVTECELPEEMHHEILERAVALAKIAWQGATMTQVAAAQK